MGWVNRWASTHHRSSPSPAQKRRLAINQNQMRLLPGAHSRCWFPHETTRGLAWPRPARPQWMTPEEYCAFPDQLQVRETRTDHQILVTTMTSRRKASKDDLAQLYARRWNVELDLRNIKTTMGMEVLHCRTPR